VYGRINRTGTFFVAILKNENMLADLNLDLVNWRKFASEQKLWLPNLGDQI
jgi:hypothetical protein